MWGERGEHAHEATLRAIATIEHELAALVGTDVLDQVTGHLPAPVDAIRAAPSP